MQSGVRTNRSGISNMNKTVVSEAQLYKAKENKLQEFREEQDELVSGYKLYGNQLIDDRNVHLS